MAMAMVLESGTGMMLCCFSMGMRLSWVCEARMVMVMAMYVIWL